MTRNSLRGGLALLGLLSLAFFACTSDEPVGSAQVLGTFPQSLSTSDVTEVRVTVSAADMVSRTESLTVSGGTWGGVLGELPAGTQRTFVAEAFDASGTKLYAGQATGVTILAGQTTVVSILLQQVTPPPVFENAVPVITSTTVTPGTVAPGGSVALVASVRDDDVGDSLTYAWTAPAGSFASASSASTTWTAPQTAGPVTLTFTATDSRGASATVSFTVTVASTQGGANVDVRINTWPQVSRVTASPGAVEVGETTQVVASVSDSDGDTVTYEWAASCAGTWADATSATARFTPSALPVSDTCPNCQLTVTAKDGRGGQATGTLSICVGQQPSARFPPDIVEASRSAASVGAGGSVTLAVRATDPQASALTFSWAANPGTLSAPVSSANASEVVWTSPACVPEGVSPSITATVTNAFGLSTSVTFSIAAVACPQAACGNGLLEGAEACDDGNTLTETECPYGTATCTACDASCSSVLPLTGPVCGDGLTSNGETCDDGNALACGSCSAMCERRQLAKAVGSITAAAGGEFSDGETFTLNDGLNPPVVFEFDKNFSVGAGRISVPLANSYTEAQVASVIASIIGSQSDRLDISAVASASVVQLMHKRDGAFGNRAIGETVFYSGFRVSDMAGGAGADCPEGTRCVSNADCDPSLACRADGTCGVP